MVRLAVVLLMAVSGLVPVHAQDSESETSPERSPELSQDLPQELSPGQSTEAAMTLERMEAILRALDPEATANGSQFMLTIEDIQVFVIADANNDRMRVMTPIRSQEGISSGELTRMMQANFDSALDARYAIAQNTLWSVFIHPLSPLEKNELISGIGQVVNLLRSYGTVYSSGALSFGGGDSDGINRQLIEQLLDKGEEV